MESKSRQISSHLDETGLTLLEQRAINLTSETQKKEELYQTFMTQYPDINVILYEN